MGSRGTAGDLRGRLVVGARDRHAVGYGDISRSRPQGRLVATVLMLVGIGTLGMPSPARAATGF
jgi:hypothetical protein